jgi:hypothetical protein
MYLKDHRIIKKVRSYFGIEKPYALPWGEWQKWTDTTREQKPVGFFLTETLPGFLGNSWKKISSPYHDTCYYVRNRFIRRSHMLRTDCAPGDYMDTDDKILSALANAVIDHVEIELAFKSRWCGTEESKAAKWKNGRCPELGLAHIAWEKTLLNDDASGFDESHELYNTPSSQAESAIELEKIYLWAKGRNTRPDPYDVSGWTAYCDKYRDQGLFNEITDDQQMAEKTAALAALRAMEDAQLQEDTDMLIQLIRIRGSLWT